MNRVTKGLIITLLVCLSTTAFCITMAHITHLCVGTWTGSLALGAIIGHVTATTFTTKE